MVLPSRASAVPHLPSLFVSKHKPTSSHMQFPVAPIENRGLGDPCEVLTIVGALRNSGEQKITDADPTLPTRVVETHPVCIDADDRQRRHAMLVEGPGPTNVQRWALAHRQHLIGMIGRDVDPPAPANTV